MFYAYVALIISLVVIFQEYAMLLNIGNFKCLLLERKFQSFVGPSFVEVVKLEPQVDNFHPGNQNIITDLIKEKSIFNILEITKLGEEETNLLEHCQQKISNQC